MKTKHIKKYKLKKATNLLIIAFWGCILIQIIYILKSLKSIRKLSVLLKILNMVR